MVPCFAPSPGRISPLLVGFLPSCQAGERNGTRLDSSAEEPPDNTAEPWKCLFLELTCGGSLSGEVPQPHPSPHGHSQRVDSQGRKGKSSLVARDREKLERSDEDGSRARNVGGQREWGAIGAAWSHVGNRENVWAVPLLPCTPSVLGGQNHGGKSMGRKTLF